MKSVILAGGKGTRLRPYTTNFPKPLMPVGDKPILELVIDHLKSYAITDILITIGHLGNLIQTFFDDGMNFGVKIRYSVESEPLGTAGPLDLLRDQLDDTFLLVNGDILIDVDIHKLVNFHKKNKALATVVLNKRTVTIDYGVVEISENNEFTGWNEKPVLDYYVSTGFYILEPAALNHIPGKKFFNLPDLILALHNSGKKVAAYIHDGFWLDIGRPDDYERACQIYDKG